MIGFSNEELSAVLSGLYRFHSFDKMIKLPIKVFKILLPLNDLVIFLKF